MLQKIKVKCSEDAACHAHSPVQGKTARRIRTAATLGAFGWLQAQCSLGKAREWPLKSAPSTCQAQAGGEDIPCACRMQPCNTTHWSLHMHADVRMHAAANDSVPCTKRGKHLRWSSKCVCTPNAGRLHLHAGVCERRKRDQHDIPLRCSVQLCLAGKQGRSPARYKIRHSGGGGPCKKQKGTRNQLLWRNHAFLHSNRCTALDIVWAGVGAPKNFCDSGHQPAAHLLRRQLVGLAVHPSKRSL